jgi:glycosyltransferase involved in cell wall biosynthesis
VGRPKPGEDCEVSIIIPAYNEASYIDRCVDSVEKTMRGLTKSYEIILAEDGSTDNTRNIIEKITQERPEVYYVHSDERLGRGKALKTAFRYAKGKILVYMDADLSVDLHALGSLIKATEDGYDVAVGSRHVEGSRVKRPLYRWSASMVYNLLVRVLFRDGVYDHQCGFKAFRKELLNFITGSIQANGWFWDTEIIVKSNKKGYHTIEIPVEWTENRKGSESKVRLLNDTIYFMGNLTNLWLNQRRDGF